MDNASNGDAGGSGATAPRQRQGWSADRVVPEEKVKPAYEQWATAFFDALARTSNVTSSAKLAGINPRTAYKAKQSNAEFNRRWREALCEGYELLEMSLLQRMREGQLKRADGKAVRTYENAVALRLLAVHRAEAAKFRAQRDNEDADAILLSINAKLEKMRSARLAAARAPIDVVGVLPPPADAGDDAHD